jgi:aminopeptidase N
MRACRWFAAGSLLLGLAACGDDGGALDVDAGVYPPMADLARDIVDTGLDVDLAARTAKATITLAPSGSTGASFEVGDLTITSVTANGLPLMFRVAQKQLDVGVPPSTEPLTLVIDYGFRLHENSDGLDSDGFTLTWPYYCGNLFPCHSHPTDGTRFELSVHGQAAGTVVAPPTIPAEAPSYMVAWATGEYTRLELGTTTAGTKVGMWYGPNELQAATAGGAHLRAGFDWLEQHVGPYTFGDTVGSVSAHWGRNAYGGMEHHPYWHVASIALADETVNLHEASHGWWGNGIRIRCWEDFVLSEGAATYYEGRLLEETGATQAAQNTWAGIDQQLANWRNGDGGGVAWPQSCGELDVLDDGLFSRVPYVKGAAFLRALEQKIGRAMFDRVMMTFYGRWKGKAAGVVDLLQVTRELSGYDAAACAQLWLVNRAVPPLAPCS